MAEKAECTRQYMSILAGLALQAFLTPYRAG
jgi:hypothetical protein